MSIIIVYMLTYYYHHHYYNCSIKNTMLYNRVYLHI